MDPDEALNNLRSALIARDIEAACEAFDALDSWLAKGGFPPERWGGAEARLINQIFSDL